MMMPIVGAAHQGASLDKTSLHWSFFSKTWSYDIKAIQIRLRKLIEATLNVLAGKQTFSVAIPQTIRTLVAELNLTRA